MMRIGQRQLGLPRKGALIGWWGAWGRGHVKVWIGWIEDPDNERVRWKTMKRRRGRVVTARICSSAAANYRCVKRQEVYRTTHKLQVLNIEVLSR